MDNWRATPIYIISYNNLNRGFRRLVGWLQSAGMTDITVIDNHSTWQPLLRYYETLCDVKIMFQSENYGHDVFWRLGYHLHQTERFIVTDPDVLPAEGCPKDLVLRMHQVADKYKPAKVGPGIRIDNIPDSYELKDLMLRSECKYWDESARTQEGNFFAGIDTTFALYEPGASKWEGTHVRLDFPYVVEHLPWYIPSAEAHEERDFYRATAIPGISHSQ